jgi:hypothetical protein
MISNTYTPFFLDRTRRRQYEVRWANKEHFTQLRVMPRMILDHLPENILAALDAVLEQCNEEIANTPESVLVS